MRKRMTTVAIVLIFLVGLSVLLYPSVADYFNARNQSRAVASYHDAVRELGAADLSEMLEAARAYNEKLLSNPQRFSPTEEETEEYRSLLSVTLGGIMGTLEVKAIGVDLPIYHGTSDAVLQIGAGHLEGSSLPVGGPGTHTVVTGHRGLPSSTLLTHLDRVQEGDIITLHVLNETLYYRVDHLSIVVPEDFSEMGIVEGMDYCTLFTCTPYGINSHRMLVRGYRIDAPEAEEEVKREIRSEAGRINIYIPLLAIVAPAFIIILTFQIVKFFKTHGRGKRK